MLGTEGIGLWWLLPLILIAICFFGARGCCFGGRHRNGDGSERTDGSSSDSPLDILSKRYARGEIDDEEYERKRKTITQEKKGVAR